MPILTRKRVIAAAVEATCGTAETLATAQTPIWAYDPKIVPSIEMTERQRLGSFDNWASIPAGRSGTCSFKLDITGDDSGGVPLWASTILPMFGFVVGSGQTYTPKTLPPGTTTAYPRTGTLATYDGRVKRIRGAVGTRLSIGLESGKLVQADAELAGIYDSAADATMLALTAVTGSPIRFASATCTIGGVSTPVASMTISVENQTTLLEDPRDVSGYGYGLIGGRKISVTLNPEGATTTSKARLDALLASTEAALVVTIGASNNMVTFSAPKCQYMDTQEEDGNGVSRDALTLQCNGSSASGDDAFVITFG